MHLRSPSFAAALLVSSLLSACDSSSSTTPGEGTPTPPDTRTFGVSWNGTVTYGSLTDARDGRVYRTVVLGNQTWMAQNLAYRRASGSTDSVGTCYYESPDSCAKYGALYTWEEAMAGASSSNAVPSAVQGVCPAGWHLPSDAEWTAMEASLKLGEKTGTALKSATGWNSDGAGTDSLGFRGLPGGYLYCGSMYRDNGRSGTWWTSTSLSSTSAHDRTLSDESDALYAQNTFVGNSVSVRCAKD